MERVNAPDAENDRNTAAYPVNLPKEMIEESRQIRGELKLIANVIRTRPVPTDLGEEDIEMTLEEIVGNSCIVCLTPAQDIVEG